MSMLAETRRKNKWSFNPRGLKNGGETEKFGKSLLEKLGWTEGQGLGKSNQGRLDPVSVKVKNDAKGVGYQGRAEAVLAHQDDFEALLGDLAASHENSVPVSPELSGDEMVTKHTNKQDEEDESLKHGKEHKRNRQRYHKARSAKDTSRYSSKDLEGIVGSAAKKYQEPEVIENLQQSDHRSMTLIEDENGEVMRPSFSIATETANSTSDSQESQKPDKDSNDEGIKFSYGGDLNSYFAQKMEEKKNRAAATKRASDVMLGEVDSKKAKKKKKEKKTKDPLMQQNHESQELPEAKKCAQTVLVSEKTVENEEEIHKCTFTHGGDINEYFARKMKEKKTNVSQEIPQTKIVEPKNAADDDLARDSVVIKVTDEVKKKKKSKKEKNQDKDVNLIDIASDKLEAEIQLKEKKKKKAKSVENGNSHGNIESNLKGTDSISEGISKKLRKQLMTHDAQKQESLHPTNTIDNKLIKKVESLPNVKLDCEDHSKSQKKNKKRKREKVNDREILESELGTTKKSRNDEVPVIAKDSHAAIPKVTAGEERNDSTGDKSKSKRRKEKKKNSANKLSDNDNDLSIKSFKSEDTNYKEKITPPNHSLSESEDRSKMKGPSGKEKKKEKKKADHNDMIGFNGSNVLSIKGYGKTKKHSKDANAKEEKVSDRNLSASKPVEMSKVKGPAMNETNKIQEEKKQGSDENIGFKGANVLSIKGYGKTKKM